MATVATHYDNLKVARNAPPEVIRAAYKTLTQKYHPDKNSDPDAARIMRLLNQAYDVLSDPASRAKHDEWIRRQEAGSSVWADAEDEDFRDDEEEPSPPPPPPQATRRRVVLPVGGSGPASVLPFHVQQVIAARSRRNAGDQEHFYLTTQISGLVVRAGFCLGWLGILLTLAGGYRWSDDTASMYAVVSVVVGAYCGAQLWKINLWFNAPFRPSFIVTPLYMVETTWDRVSYWPVGLVRGIQATRHLRNGSYTHTEFEVDVEPQRRSYAVASESLYARIVNLLNSAKGRYVRAQELGQQGLIDEVDEVKGTLFPEPRGNIRQPRGFPLAWLAGAGLFLLAFFGARTLNDGQSPAPPKPGSSYSRSAPAQTYSAPPEVRNVEPVRPAPVAAAPSYRAPATIQTGPPADYIADHIGAARIPSGPAYIRGEPVAMSNGLSTVEVDARQTSEDVLVKLVRVEGVNAYPVRTFFIPAGSSFTAMNVDAGTYEVRYLSRRSGATSKSESFTLEEVETYEGTQFTNMTLTLYTVSNGNMQMQSIDPSEF